MTDVVGVTPSGITSAPTSALMNADLPALNSPTTTSRKSAVRCSAARLTASLVLVRRWVAGKGLREPLQQRQLVFDQPLFLAREQRPGRRSLTVAAGATRQLEHASTHLAPIVLRAQSGIGKPSSRGVSLTWRIGGDLTSDTSCHPEHSSLIFLLSQLDGPGTRDGAPLGRAGRRVRAWRGGFLALGWPR